MCLNMPHQTKDCAQTCSLQQNTSTRGKGLTPTTSRITCLNKKQRKLRVTRGLQQSRRRNRGLHPTYYVLPSGTTPAKSATAWHFYSELSGAKQSKSIDPSQATSVLQKKPNDWCVCVCVWTTLSSKGSLSHRCTCNLYDFNGEEFQHCPALNLSSIRVNSNDLSLLGPQVQ